MAAKNTTNQKPIRITISGEAGSGKSTVADIIAKKLKHYSDKLKADIVITTGGTGLGPRDVTPEATLSVIERDVPGLAEYMRLEGLKKTRRSILSRGVCGMRKKTLIINLPGSPKGVKESLGLIIDIIPHALHMMAGHGHGKS